MWTHGGELGGTSISIMMSMGPLGSLWMILVCGFIRVSLDLHPEQQKACLPGTYKKPKPSLSSEDLLGDDEFDPGELEGKVTKHHNGTFFTCLASDHKR